jgi:hypothetical protein
VDFMANIKANSEGRRNLEKSGGMEGGIGQGE